MTQATPEAHSAAASRPPLLSIEWLRLLASLGIVAFHLDVANYRVGYAGLPVFTMLTAAMAARSARGKAFAAYGRGRLRRLLLPWLAWSVFYAALNVFLAWLQGQPPFGWWRWSTLLIGTYFHLWYLPFAALATLGIAGLAARPTTPWLHLALGIVQLPISGALIFLDLPAPLPQWCFVLPGVWLGLAFAQLPFGDRRALPALAAIVAATWLACGLLWALGWLDLMLPYAVGVAATSLATMPRWTASPSALALTRAALGIYVLHPVFDLALAFWQVHTAVELASIVRIVVVFAASLLATMLLRRTPLRAIL